METIMKTMNQRLKEIENAIDYNTDRIESAYVNLRNHNVSINGLSTNYSLDDEFQHDTRESLRDLRQEIEEINKEIQGLIRTMEIVNQTVSLMLKNPFKAQQKLAPEEPKSI